MFRAGSLIGERALALATCFVSVAALTSCGGGSTGNSRDSGINKTYLSVEASDADGDTLHYQWRVTGGSIDNRDSPADGLDDARRAAASTSPTSRSATAGAATSSSSTPSTATTSTCCRRRARRSSAPPRR